MEKPRFIHLQANQQILLYKRLALYLKSGIPISRAISFIAEDAQSKSTLYILQEIDRIIASGLPLSRGLAQFPKVFSLFTIGFIGTGESSGVLAETLERLAVILGKQASLRRKIVGALAYPLIIFCGTICVALFLTLFIFPKIVPILKGFRTQLPLSTRVLIGINTVCVHYWWAILLLVGLGGIGTAVALKKKAVQIAVEKIYLRIPVFSSLYRHYTVATFTRTLSLQLRGGVRIVSALVLVRSALPGSLYPTAVEEIEKQITSGQRFSLALRTKPLLFPPLLCQMVAAGELTGTLSANLESLSELYEDSLDELTKNLTVLIEPVLMVCMGFIVGFVALAIITPIYAVTQNLHVQ